MFIMVTGNPGSGKSYYAVSYIHDHLDDYRCVYANINGLKLGGKIRPLNHPAIYEILEECKAIYDHQISILGETGETNVIDEPIIEYLKSVDFIEYNADYDDYLERKSNRDAEPFLKRIWLNLTKPIKEVPMYKPTLLIYDEAQNQFPAFDTNTGKELRNADPVISWWVSYHRHLFMDVMLLSQYYQKVHTAYRRDIEYFLDAVPSASDPFGALFGNFSYKKHKETPYFKKNKVGIYRVKKRPEVFEMYKSGDKVRTKSIVLPWIIFAAVLFVLVIAIFSYVISSYGTDVSSDSNVSKPAAPRKIVSHRVVDDVITVSDRKYVSLKCFNDHCVNSNYGIDISVDYLKDLLKNTSSKLLGIKKYGANFATVYFLASPEFLGLFDKRSDKKDEKSFTILN